MVGIYNQRVIIRSPCGAAPAHELVFRAAAGFDFLGFRIQGPNIRPSVAALSRLDERISRLYEQGADAVRVGEYARRWVGGAEVRRGAG